jgi:NAD(P)-dependent dehydrogenase (short-subunit alcohol dehydrogenase family)
MASASSAPTPFAAPSPAAGNADQRGTVMITGASSGVGLYAAKAMAQRGWHVVMACRDLSKARAAASSLAIPESSLTLLQVDLGDLESVRQLVQAFHATGRSLDALVCNAASESCSDRISRVTSFASSKAATALFNVILARS